MGFECIHTHTRTHTFRNEKAATAITHFTSRAVGDKLKVGGEAILLKHIGFYFYMGFK